MHDSRERRPGSGRPSLLSADQVPASEDRSVLSQLDGRGASARALPSPVRPAGRRGARAAVFGAALAVIAGGAWFALSGSGDAPDAPLAAAQVVPEPVKAPVAASAPAPALASPPAPAPAPADAAEAPVTAAVIQDEPPAARTDKQDLASLLNAPGAAPAPVPEARPKTPARDEAPRKHDAAKKPAAEKLAHKEKERARTPAAAARPKPAQKTVPKRAEPAVDNDVALLAALLAHTKTPDSGSPDDIFRRCATNATAAEVQRCRVRVCQSSAKGAEGCKSVRMPKAPG